MKMKLRRLLMMTEMISVSIYIHNRLLLTRVKILVMLRIPATKGLIHRLLV
jgi:hypothetical protein